MGNNQTEKAFEEKRLAQTISLAEEQLKQAKEAADKKKSENDQRGRAQLSSHRHCHKSPQISQETIVNLPKGI